jgi:hypothetical protein
MRKKSFYIIPIVFSLLIASPLLFMAGFQTFQLYVSHRMEFSLKRNDLQTLTFSASKVQWVEAGREILVEGKMFDIKSYSIKDGVFTAQGLFDEKETKVVNLLQGHFTDFQQDFMVVKLLLLAQCFIALLYFSYSFFSNQWLLKAPGLFINNYINPYLLITSPPPKSLLHL